MYLPDRVEEGLRPSNAYNLLLLWAPNIFNPRKLVANLRHPIGEVFHTNHKQRPFAIKKGTPYYVVEHRLFGHLVTVDVVIPTTFPKGLLPRIKQLFDRKFYYGHDKDFPQPFMLVNRTFVDECEFNEKTHLRSLVN
jgi:hypothetical protein